MNPVPMVLTEILAALLDATPWPERGLAPEALLETFAHMHERRAVILSQLDPRVEPLSFDESTMAAELEARDAEWMRCLAAAKQATADQRISAGRVRAYGASVGP